MFDCFHKISGKLIHLIDLIHIIFPSIMKCFIFDSFYRNCRILKHLLFRIFSMSLHTYSEHKVLLFCSVHRLHNVLDQYVILRPAVLCQLQDIHKFLTCVAVESDIIKNCCTAVEITTIIMQGMCPVTKRSQSTCRTFTDAMLQYRLIWILSGSEVAKIHTGQHFKLRIGSSGSHRRHFKISRRMLRCHCMKVWRCILRGCKKFRL